MRNKFFIVIIAFLSISSCISHEAIWTEDYQQRRFDEIYEGSQKLFTDDNERKQFAKYAVEKLKVKLPDGVSSVSSDSLQKIIVKTMADYVETRKSDTVKTIAP
jgi:hypothetical protein